MKKIKVLKELPDAKVGAEFEVKNGTVTIGWILINQYALNTMIEDEWLEWVKEEKGLEEKFMSSIQRFEAVIQSGNKWATDKTLCDNLVKIAKEHSLRVIDKTKLPKTYNTTEENLVMNTYNTIRKSLKDC